VVEPSWKSALTARRIIRIARETGVARVLPVANKIASEEDRERVQRLVGEPAFAAVPADEAVARADREGLALIDQAPSSPAVLAIERLVDALRGQ
jgi:CO dehydrogenase maturation factor